MDNSWEDVGSIVDTLGGTDKDALTRISKARALLKKRFGYQDIYLLEINCVYFDVMLGLFYSMGQKHGKRP